MINVGIIGYGKMGKIRHQILYTNSDANIISVYDPMDIKTDIEKSKISEIDMKSHF